MATSKTSEVYGNAKETWFNIRRLMLLAGSILMAAVALTSYIYYASIFQNRIGSPHYLELERGLTLLSNFAPPPLLPYEAYTVVQIAADEGTATLPKREAKILELKADFYKNLDQLNQGLQGSSLLKTDHWNEIHNGIKSRGDEFWKQVETKVLPAIKTGDATAKFDQLHLLAGQFDEFVRFVEPNEDLVRQSVDAMEAESLARSDSAISVTVFSSIVLCGFIALLLFLGQATIVNAITRLAEVMGKLSKGEIHTAVPFETRGDEIGIMARALTVFKGEVAENQQRGQENQIVINSLGNGLARLAGGDLLYRIEETFPTALDGLRTSFNDAVTSLQKTITIVRHGTEGIKSGTVDIAQASDDLSRRTENQAANIEETAAAVAEITNKVKQTASGAIHARAVVESAKSEADRSGEVVRQAVDAMQQIEQSSQRITQIIGVIDEIAFQTNLLALNAGVEAARAGEAGRGFAVVASEVRALAQRSADAAREIKALLSTSQQAVEQGVGLVAETGTSLKSIIDRVAEINGIVAEIAANAEQQASGLQEVNSAVDQMDQVTQQNASMVEQTTAATRALTEQSVELAKTVASFVVQAAQADGHKLSQPPSATHKPVQRAPERKRALGSQPSATHPVGEASQPAKAKPEPTVTQAAPATKSPAAASANKSGPKAPPSKAASAAPTVRTPSAPISIPRATLASPVSSRKQAAALAPQDDWQEF